MRRALLCRPTTTVLVALAVGASAAHAQTRGDSSVAASTPIFAVTIRPDTTLRKTPFDTSALDTAAARRLAGCYAVYIGTWSDPRANGGRIWAPAEIRLDTVRAPHARRGFGLVVETPGSVNPSHFAQPVQWAPVKRDSLQASIAADGTSDVAIFARRHADGTFTAIARYFTDAIARDPLTGRWLWETYPAAPVQLTPHACASAG